MKELKRLYYLIKHGITGCNEDDMTMFKDVKGVCNKCGRTFFLFKKY